MSEPDARAQTQAQACFERARQASEAGDLDRAIDAYLDGLRHSPDAVEGGHIELRVLALRRQERGGTKPTVQEANERLSQGKYLKYGSIEDRVKNWRKQQGQCPWVYPFEARR